MATLTACSLEASRRHRRNVDADELADVPRQGTRCARPGFLGNGEQRVAVDQRLLAALHQP